MIEFQQSQALTSHFESFWSIVTCIPFNVKIKCVKHFHGIFFHIFQVISILIGTLICLLIVINVFKYFNENKKEKDFLQALKERDQILREILQTLQKQWIKYRVSQHKNCQKYFGNKSTNLNFLKFCLSSNLEFWHSVDGNQSH